jgi:membrane protein implicated in regulation of membrane protease activity
VEDWSKRIPDMLEAATDRVRSLTVDRASRILKWVTLGLVIASLALLAVFFLLIGLGRITEGLIAHACGDCSWAMEVAYAAIGGLFLLLGVWLWAARNRRKNPEGTNE